MKRATAYRRKGHFVVHASARTTDGVWILTDPCVKLDQSRSDEDLGEATRAAISASRAGVPHPRNLAELLDPLLRQAGVKTWSAFAKTATCAEIEATGKVSVIPTRNLGVDEGFQPDPDRAHIVDLDATDSLGASVRRALMVSVTSPPRSKG
jgi:hypothetical protein